MTINYDQLIDIENTLKEFPNAKLQIVTKNRDVKIINELIDKGYYLCQIIRRASIDGCFFGCVQGSKFF